MFKSLKKTFVVSVTDKIHNDAAREYKYTFQMTQFYFIVLRIPQTLNPHISLIISDCIFPFKIVL